MLSFYRKGKNIWIISQDFILHMKTIEKINNLLLFAQIWSILQIVILLIITADYYYYILCVYFLSFRGSKNKSELAFTQGVCRWRLDKNVSFCSQQAEEGLCSISQPSMPSWSQVTLGPRKAVSFVYGLLQFTSVRGLLFLGSLIWAHQQINTIGILKHTKKHTQKNTWEKYGRLNIRKWEGGLWKEKQCVRGNGASHHVEEVQGTRMWEARLDPGNGIWVCIADWIKTEFGRSFWTRLFSQLNVLVSRVSTTAF